MPSVGSPSPWYFTGKGSVRSLLPVDQQVIEIDDTTAAVIVAVVLGVIAEVFIGHVDLVTIGLVVAEFVDGVRDGVSFDDQEERRVRAAEFEQPRFPEPATRVDDGDVGQVVSVELAGCRDLAIV